MLSGSQGGVCGARSSFEIDTCGKGEGSRHWEGAEREELAGMCA